MHGFWEVEGGGKEEAQEKEGEEEVQSERDQLELNQDHFERDELEGGFTLEDNVERTPSPPISGPLVDTLETSHLATSCGSSTKLPTPFDGDFPITTSPTLQASDPFSGEVPEATTYQPAANPFDLFDEIDSSYREVTPKAEDEQKDDDVTRTPPTPPNQFDSYSASPSMPGGGHLEDGLPEEESLSDFALETASYSSSLDLSCLLEATLERTTLPSPPYLQVQEDHFSPEVGALMVLRVCAGVCEWVGVHVCTATIILACCCSSS